MRVLNKCTIKFLAFALIAISVATGSVAQPSLLKLRSGQFLPTQSFLNSINPGSELYSQSIHNDRLYLIIQCKKSLGEQDRKKLADIGIRIVDFIPEKSYLVEINKPISEASLRSAGIHNIVLLQPNFKVFPVLMGKASENITEAAAELNITIVGFPGVPYTEIASELEKRLIQYQIPERPGAEALHAKVTALQLLELAKLPAVYYIEEYFGEDSILNEESNILSGTAYLQNETSGIGKGLTGKGVVIGMGDNGGAGHHLDHFYKTLEPAPTMVYHSTHVAGILTGAGLINPRIKGRAPGAFLLVSGFSDITVSAAQYYTQFGLVLTNNSYGSNGIPCNSFGAYTSTSRSIDRLSLNFPEITHVYAAGNQSTSNCSPYPPGYSTVFQGPQSAKNTITVGATQKFNSVNPLSKGPTYDGRIKPEITAIGINVVSTVPPNIYSTNSGTSMAAPQVTGSLALLIERYRQLKNGKNPLSGLLKNLILNSTTDQGATGPDFAFGYGGLDARTALEMLETETYFNDSIAEGQVQSKSIIVGAGVSELKVMLSWPDVPASLYSVKSLVNDLDIVVKSPTGQIIKPLVLNPLAALNTAIPGEDHTNSVEQVIIRDPVPGNYIISVSGYEIPLGPQAYFVSYNQVKKGLKLISPLKGDKLKQGETLLLSWTDPGSNPIGYDIEFSSGGGIWQTIGSVPGNSRFFQFVVPALVAENCIFRVRNRSNIETVVAGSICILPELSFLLTSPCAGIVEVKWQKPLDIDSVSVLQVVAGQMKTIVTSSDSSFLVKGLSVDSTYWFSVKPFSGSVSGERSIAQPIQALGVNCSLPKFDGDIALLSIMNPTGGRKKSSSERSANENIVIKLVNKDNDPTVAPIVVKTYLDNLLFSQDTITTTIPGLAEYSFTLGKQINLSTIGIYQLKVELVSPTDPDSSNNAITSKIKIVANEPISLPLEEDFETLVDTVYRFPSYFAVDGKDNWDFSTSNVTGFLKTRVSAGNKALVPGKLPIRPLTVNFDLVGTYNFSNYASPDELFLSINTKNRSFTGICWIRGSDTSNWINLPFNEAVPYIQGNHGNITRTLKSASQVLSSSFQIRLQQTRNLVEFDKPDTLSYFDDLKLYKISDDVKVALVRSNTSFFFPGDTAIITATITNNVNKAESKLPLQISCGAFRLVDTIETLLAYDTSVRVYRIPISSIEVIGRIPVVVKTVLDADANKLNDENLASITIIPIAKIFPYLEGFETGNNGWTSNLYYGLENHWKDKIFSKPANGSKSWYTNNITTDFPDLRTSVLSSSGFDISQLPNAYLSLSMKSYFRTGRDSGQIQISLNRGQSWRNLNSVQSFNWYNSPAKTAFTDSNKIYWHSITCKLPDTATKIMLRVLSIRVDSFKAVNWLGNIAVDDIHIYSLRNEIFGGNNASGKIVADSSQWRDLLIDDKIVASVLTKDKEPIQVDWSYNSTAKNIDIFNGQKLLKRRWILKANNQPQKPSKIRLYFSDSDAEWLRSLNACTGCADTVSAYHFSIYQFEGAPADINGLKRDNPISRYRMIPSSAYNLVPYANGYYAEFDAIPNGEFFIQMPERFPGPRVVFTVVPQGKQDIRIEWVTEDENLIAYYEIEKAVGDEKFEAGEFELVDTVNAQNQRFYSISDKKNQSGSTIYYRLKIVYKNGYIRYSPEQSLEANSNETLRIYPNPSKGLFTIKLYQNSSKPLVFQVLNAAGQVLQTQSRTATGNLDEITLDLSSSKYSSGVYLLKIFNGTEVSTYRLVKQ